MGNTKFHCLQVLTATTPYDYICLYHNYLYVFLFRNHNESLVGISLGISYFCVKIKVNVVI